MGDPVVYFEIGGPDDEALHRFYGALFEWTFKTPEPGYAIVDTHAGEGIRGGIGRSRLGPSWATFYVEVEDIKGVVEKAQSLGGKIVIPLSDIPGVLTWGMISDPDGLLIGLRQQGKALGEPPSPSSGSAADWSEQRLPPSPGSGAAVDWFEIMGRDGDRTRGFYQQLFSWRSADSGRSGYWLTTTEANLGIEGAIGAGSGALWATIYARIPNAEETLARAEQLGGKRIYGPNSVNNDTLRTGAFRDPAGNVIGVYSRLGP
jgi:uncharacterized protein